MKHSSLQIIRDEHACLAAMLQSMRLMVQRGTAGQAQNFFEVMRAMLFYIDEFPERLHHPKESNLLFPRVVRKAPQVMGVVDRLERDHLQSTQYVDSYLEHMRLEEIEILPQAEKVLSDDDWHALDAEFEKNADPLTGQHPPGPEFEKLFSRIVMKAPAPIGLGE